MTIRPLLDHTIHVRISEEMMDWLNIQSNDSGMKPSDLIRVYIRRMMREALAQQSAARKKSRPHPSPVKVL